LFTFRNKQELCGFTFQARRTAKYWKAERSHNKRTHVESSRYFEEVEKYNRWPWREIGDRWS
jgi:hypothetical protein